MISKAHKLPEIGRNIFETILSKSGQKYWRSEQGMLIKMFSMEESELMSEDLEFWRKMPGWIILGEDQEDALLCLDLKTKRCSMVEIDNLNQDYAQEIAHSLETFLSQGIWLSLI